jgi:Iron-containing alcohol dehydrogenase
MSQRTFLSPSGIRSLQTFLHKECSNLQQSPVLIVSSEPSVAAASSGGAGAVSLPQVKNASQWLHFTLSKQFGFRTVPVTISSAFPTVQDVESRGEMIRRTGASSIVAVGSGAAMDLAKALAATDKNHSMEQLLLVPSTNAAMMAAGSSHSLLLDSVEETLIPHPRLVTCPTTVVPLDPRYTADMDSTVAVYAVAAIVLDAALRKSSNPLLPELVSELLHHLELVDVPLVPRTLMITQEEIMSLCYRAGNLLSYGLGSEDRSSPIALASSLIPSIFPHVHILSFWANLVPGLCHTLQQSSPVLMTGPIQDLVGRILAHEEWKHFARVTVADESKKGFSVPDMALSHIQSNTALCKTFDMPHRLLIDILQHSTLAEGPAGIPPSPA